MRVIPNDSFIPIQQRDPVARESLLVHSHESVRSGQLVVLVHGLGGTRYNTWGDLPRLLFEDSKSYDIGLYDYTSGMRRIRRSESISLDAHARELADDLRDGNYERIILMGHSMGGLLCKAVIKYLIDSDAQANGRRTIKRVVGLFLMATPQAGSLRIPRFLAYLTKDGKVLKAHSDFVQEINRRFSDRVCSDDRDLLDCSGRFPIPTYAVLATGDIWVDEFSSRLSLPSSQVKYMRGSHGSVVKPESREAGAYSWIRHKIDSCFAMSAPEIYLRRPVMRIAVNDEAVVQAPASDLETSFKADLTELVSDYLQARGFGHAGMSINIDLDITPQDGSFL